MSEAAVEGQAEDLQPEVQEDDFDYSPLDNWADDEKEFYSSLERLNEIPAETWQLSGLDPVDGRGLQKAFKSKWQNWDRGFGKKMEEVSAQRKEIEAQQQRLQAEYGGYQTLRQLVEPHIGEWHKMGVMPDQAAAQAFTWATQYYRDPVGTIVELAKQGGFLNAVQEALGQQEYVDPRYEELQRQNQEMQARMDGYLQSQQQAQQAQQQQQLEPMLQEIHNFQHATNEDGTLKHPYFQQVFESAAALIRNGTAQGNSFPEVLENAYQQACWAIPEAREGFLAQQAKEKAAAQTKEAEKAEQAAKRVTAKSTGGKPRKSMEAELAERLAAAFPDE